MKAISALAFGGPFDGCTVTAPSSVELYFERIPSEEIFKSNGLYRTRNMIFLGKPECPGSFSVYQYDTDQKRFKYKFAMSQGIERPQLT